MTLKRIKDTLIFAVGMLILMATTVLNLMGSLQLTDKLFKTHNYSNWQGFSCCMLTIVVIGVHMYIMMWFADWRFCSRPSK